MLSLICHCFFYFWWCSNCHWVCSPWVSSTNWLGRALVSLRQRQLAEPQNSAAARGAILAPAYHKHRRSEKTQDFWDGDGKEEEELFIELICTCFSLLFFSKACSRRAFDRSIRGCQLSWLRHRHRFPSLQGIQHNNLSGPTKSLSRLRSLNFRLLKFRTKKVLQQCYLRQNGIQHINMFFLQYKKLFKKQFKLRLLYPMTCL